MKFLEFSLFFFRIVNFPAKYIVQLSTSDLVTGLWALPRGILEPRIIKCLRHILVSDALVLILP